jgi:hypothetical protein
MQMTVPTDPLLRIPHLYHFTDVANLPSIRRLEGLFSTAKLREMGEQFCAGGDESSLALDTRSGMDCFVHLCFDVRHPMAYRLKERKPDANLMYLRINRAILYQPGVMFSTGVGYASNAESVTLAEACERGLIDFTALYSWTDWRDPEAQRKRRAAELCEVLVPDFVALTFILNLPNG